MNNSIIKDIYEWTLCLGISPSNFVNCKLYFEQDKIVAIFIRKYLTEKYSQ